MSNANELKASLRRYMEEYAEAVVERSPEEFKEALEAGRHWENSYSKAKHDILFEQIFDQFFKFIDRSIYIT